MTDLAKMMILSAQCPKNKGGGRHHLTPRARDGKMVMACVTCKLTETELLEAAK